MVSPPRSAHSTELNGSRLKVLKARDEVLREVYDDADKRLARISTDNADVYKTLLSSLILQSLLALRDEDVVVRTREADASTVDSGLQAVSEEFTDKTDGAEVNAVVDTKRFLSDNWYVLGVSAAGVAPCSPAPPWCGGVCRGRGRACGQQRLRQFSSVCGCVCDYPCGTSCPCQPLPAAPGVAASDPHRRYRFSHPTGLP